MELFSLEKSNELNKFCIFFLAYKKRSVSLSVVCHQNRKFSSQTWETLNRLSTKLEVNVQLFFLGKKRKTKTFLCVTHCFLPITTLKEPEYSNVYQRGTGRLQRGAGLIQNKVWPIRGIPEVDVICPTPL